MALLSEQFQQVVDFASTVLGALPEPGLSAARPAIRTTEVAIGNTICDAMIASLKSTVRSRAAHPSACLHRQARCRSTRHAATLRACLD